MVRNSNIYIDITCLMPHKISGIGTYARYLIHSLCHQNVDLKYTFKGSRFFKKSYFKENLIDTTHYGKPKLFYNWGKSSNDVIHGLDFKMIHPSSKVKKVVTVHDLAVFHEGYNDEKFRKKGQEQIISLLNNNYADRVITPTSFIKDEVERVFPHMKGRVFAVHHGGDHMMSDVSVNYDKSPYFLYVGNIEHRKNVLSIVRAFELFCENEKSGDLVIVGRNGFGGKDILEYAQKSIYSKRIKLKGFVGHSELTNLYERANAFVFPSFYEGFGFPIIEAMSKGCPVITSSTGAMAEVAGDGALLVQPNSVDDICHAMVNIFQNENEIKRLITLGASRVKSLSWAETASKTMAVYQS